MMQLATYLCSLTNMTTQECMTQTRLCFNPQSPIKQQEFPIATMPKETTKEHARANPGSFSSLQTGQ